MSLSGLTNPGVQDTVRMATCPHPQGGCHYITTPGGWVAPLLVEGRLSSHPHRSAAVLSHYEEKQKLTSVERNHLGLKIPLI